jgi:photosystem II stability/assembly factor-like uncharacterized protein
MSTTMLAVGTVKGLFLGTSEDGADWQWEGPAFGMTRVAAVAFDARQDPPRLLVGGGHEHWGPVISHSDDLGASWVEGDDAALRFPDQAGAAVQRVWQLAPGPADRPGEVWAGVEPAALFRSDDGGASFSLVTGLWDHPQRSEWQPGFGGLCLHTVLPHPDDASQVLIAVSAAGVYRSQDGGETWAPSNSGIEVSFMPEKFPEFGQCVHKVARDCEDPDRLILQNHGGVFRSSDGGASWERSEEGLPATFGFGLASHPRRSGTAFLFPLIADMNRMPPDGKARVFRTDDFGASWTSTSDGLPQEGFHTVVLRDALATDGGDPLGVYFGTRSGGVFASRDEGASWKEVAAHLPEVLCVRAAVVG